MSHPTTKDKTVRAMLPIWVIYDHPSDYPNHFVVRRQFAGQGHVVADLKCQLADSLEDARAFIPEGLTRLNRDPNDDPVIVESWI